MGVRIARTVYYRGCGSSISERPAMTVTLILLFLRGDSSSLLSSVYFFRRVNDDVNGVAVA